VSTGLAVMKHALDDLSKQNKAHQHFSLMHTRAKITAKRFMAGRGTG
jgi:hypothetical protein